MKDTQQFKALVMHKVRLQQQQKQQRLQKRRAVTISLSTLCAGIICVFSVLWFANVFPLQFDGDRGTDGSHYGGSLDGTNIPQSQQGVAGSDKNNTNGSQNTDSIPEALPGGADNTTSSQINQAIPNGSSDGIDDPTWPQDGIGGNEDPGSNVNSATPPSNNTNGSTSSPIVYVFDSLTLSDLSPQIAADLSLQSGVLTDKIAVQTLVAMADDCIGDAAEQSDNAAVLFSLLAEHGAHQWRYTFYQDNTLVVQKDEQSTTHRTDPDAFERLKNALQKVTFSQN